MDARAITTPQQRAPRLWPHRRAWAAALDGYRADGPARSRANASGSCSIDALADAGNGPGVGRGGEPGSSASKQIDELTTKADELREQAERKGQELASAATHRIDDLSESGKCSKKCLIALLLAGAAATAVVVVKKGRG